MDSEANSMQCFKSPSGDELQIAPDRGGLVTSWICNGRERLYFDAERFKDPRKSVRGGIPILFPICGDLPEDILNLPEGSFKLPQHGFARNMPWRLETLPDQQGIRLSLHSTTQTLECYPFRFELTIEYRLQPSALEVSVDVHHRVDSYGTMPFSIGLHPYFKVSSLENVQIEGLALDCVDQKTSNNSDTESLISGLSEGVDILTSSDHDPCVTMVDQGTRDRLRMFTSSPFDFVVIWSDPPRSMVCLEPWTAPRGSLTTGNHCIYLKPGVSSTSKVRYQISEPISS